jgi:putative restriction endonuclease
MPIRLNGVVALRLPRFGAGLRSPCARSAPCRTTTSSTPPHIMADAHELPGQPVIANGIALSKMHHAAFDNHLMGIDPDGRVHVSERLLMLHDGPLLEQSPKAIAGTTMRLPRSHEHHPDRDRLATRLEQFERVA